MLNFFFFSGYGGESLRAAGREGVPFYRSSKGEKGEYTGARGSAGNPLLSDCERKVKKQWQDTKTERL